MALHEGTKVNLGGRDFILPPLTLKSLRTLGPKLAVLDTINGVPDAGQVDVMVELVLASANRNYPELTADDMLELLDLGNIQNVFPAIMAASGLKQKEALPGEGLSL